MMTFSEFVKNDALEKTVVSDCDNYRQKFIKIIEKAGVSDSDIQDGEALKKIKSVVSWNWVGFFFPFYWAIYRKERIIGWGTLFVYLTLGFLSVVSVIIDGYDFFFLAATALLIAMYGNSYLLHNCVRSYVETTSEVDRKQASTSQLWIAIILNVFAAILFLIWHL